MSPWCLGVLARWAWRVQRCVRGGASKTARTRCRTARPPPAHLPLQAWAELADGSCRWRQSGGEVRVIALRVPRELPARQLAVAMEPYSIRGEQALTVGGGGVMEGGGVGGGGACTWTRRILSSTHATHAHTYAPPRPLCSSGQPLERGGVP